jgi:hypothetical protein
MMMMMMMVVVVVVVCAFSNFSYVQKTEAEGTTVMGAQLMCERGCRVARLCSLHQVELELLPERPAYAVFMCGLHDNI